MIDFFTKEERVAYGTRLEPYFLQKLSEVTNDTITKTSYCFSLLDFEGQTSWSELKVRTADWFYTDPKIQEEGWLIPACKFLDAAWKKSEGKDVFFFYYWALDQSLWMIKFEPTFLMDFLLGIPKDHKDNQLHYFIHQDKWTFCGTLPVDAESLRKPKTCLIIDD